MVIWPSLTENVSFSFSENVRPIREDHHESSIGRHYGDNVPIVTSFTTHELQLINYRSFSRTNHGVTILQKLSYTNTERNMRPGEAIIIFNCVTILQKVSYTERNMRAGEAIIIFNFYFFFILARVAVNISTAIFNICLGEIYEI